MKKDRKKYLKMIKVCKKETKKLLKEMKDYVPLNQLFMRFIYIYSKFYHDYYVNGYNVDSFGESEAYAYSNKVTLSRKDSTFMVHYLLKKAYSNNKFHYVDSKTLDDVFGLLKQYLESWWD